jgi:hypothetical protein
MSSTLESLKDEVWNAFAAVKLCKALEVVFVDWNLQASSPITIDIGKTEESVSDILKSEDHAQCKKVNQITADLLNQTFDTLYRLFHK